MFVKFVWDVWKVCLGFLGSLFGFFVKFRKFVWYALGCVNGAAGGLSNSSLQPMKTPTPPHFILIAPHSLPSKFHFPQLIRCSSQFGCSRSLPPLRVQQRPGVDARECSSKAQPPPRFQVHCRRCSSCCSSSPAPAERKQQILVLEKHRDCFLTITPDAQNQFFISEFGD